MRRSIVAGLALALAAGCSDGGGHDAPPPPAPVTTPPPPPTAGVTMSPTDVGFGATLPGEEVRRTIAVTNHEGTTATIVALEIQPAAAHFAVRDVALPAQVRPGKTLTFEVALKSDIPFEHAANLVVRIDTGETPWARLHGVVGEAPPPPPRPDDDRLDDEPLPPGRELELISSEAAGDATIVPGAALSHDGRHAVFSADGQVLVRDRLAGATVPAGAGSHGAISADGRIVALLGSGGEVFVLDRDTGRSAPLLAVGPGARIGGLSGDGRLIALATAVPLVAEDTNGVTDAYVVDRTTGAATLASFGLAGLAGNGHSGAPSRGGETTVAISREGRHVAFVSDASDLVPGDSNGASDIFVRDLSLRWTVRVSVATGGYEAIGASREPSISANGDAVAFVSAAANLVTDDTNALGDVFVHVRSSGRTTRVSVASGGAQGGDGSPGGASAYARDGHVASPSISADARYVAFTSDFADLVGSPETGYRYGVFVYDRSARRPRWVGWTSGGGRFAAAIAAGGAYVAFDTDWANLPEDADGARDVYAAPTPN